MANLKVSEQAYPSTRYTEGAAPSTPAAGEVIQYAKADGNLYQKDDAGTETLLANSAAGALATDSLWDAAGDLVQGTGANTAAKLGAGTAGHVLTSNGAAAAVSWQAPAGGGAVATDAIWDAAGDLAVGSGANTAATLTMGAEGSALSVMDGVVGWNGATSMPGSPTTGQRVWRSDLMDEYVFNGSIWVSSHPHQISFPQGNFANGASASAVLHRLIVPGAMGGSDIYLMQVLTSFFIVAGTALSGSHKWVGTVNKTDTAGGTTSVGTITIDSGASSIWRAGTAVTINAAAGSTNVAFEINWVKTGTPGALFSNNSLTYRTIAT